MLSPGFTLSLKYLQQWVTEGTGFSLLLYFSFFKKIILPLKFVLLLKHPFSALGAAEQSLFLEQLCARARWNAVGDELSYCSSSGISAQFWVQ